MSNGNKIVENNSFHQKKKVAFYCEFEKVSSAFWGSVSTQVRKAAQCRSTGQSIRLDMNRMLMAQNSKLIDMFKKEEQKSSPENSKNKPELNDFKEDGLFEEEDVFFGILTQSQ